MAASHDIDCQWSNRHGGRDSSRPGKRRIGEAGDSRPTLMGLAARLQVGAAEFPGVMVVPAREPASLGTPKGSKPERCASVRKA